MHMCPGSFWLATQLVTFSTCSFLLRRVDFNIHIIDKHGLLAIGVEVLQRIENVEAPHGRGGHSDSIPQRKSNYCFFFSKNLKWFEIIVISINRYHFTFARKTCTLAVVDTNIFYQTQIPIMLSNLLKICSEIDSHLFDSKISYY